jgi:hypothetical protein
MKSYKLLRRFRRIGNIINNRHYLNNSFTVLTVVCLSIGVSIINGCKKFVEVAPPVHQITAAGVYDNDNAAIAVLTGLYINLSGSLSNDDYSAGLMSVSKFAGLSADEFELSSFSSSLLKAYHTNELIMASPTVGYGGESWSLNYSNILAINTALEGLTGSSSLTPVVKQQLLGEARFMRALVYFYLVNNYGGVPLVVTSNYETNRLLTRASKSEVYQLIINDLKEAQSLLSDRYVDINLKPYNLNAVERTRPTKWAATALLARTYLYNAEYAQAEAEATSVINQTSLFTLTPLSGTFLMNNKEAIFQLQPVNLGWNTEDARLFVLSAPPVGPSSYKPIYLSNSLLNSFETGDARKVSWIGNFTDGTGTYAFANKYKSAVNGNAMTEYANVLRLGEQFLIRAEARAQQNNISGAVADINMLRTRARAIPTVSVPNPLPDLNTTLTQAQVLIAILKERRVELFSEWGHRWFDLKRTGNVDAVMGFFTPNVKGGIWDPHDQLYPIPFNELQYDPNLVQNPGY